MPEKTVISENERKVMEVLWKQPGSSLAQAAKALQGTGRTYSTIKTLQGRLAAKGRSAPSGTEGTTAIPLL